MKKPTMNHETHSHEKQTLIICHDHESALTDLNPPAYAP
jgi:hypothetical protein